MSTAPRHAIVRKLVLLGLVAVAIAGCGEKGAAPVELLNVSYDPTRQLYEDVNRAFATDWSQRNGGRAIVVNQSHGGSGKQARAVIDGLGADVVTLALGYDLDVLADRGLVSPQWRDAFPERAAPYTSTIVFLVREGNPKGIRDWPDLAKDGVGVITPNPKTSGGARYNYLAAWHHALTASGGDAAAAEQFVDAVFANVVVLDSGARGSTTTFIERGIGDVLIAWENEAKLALADGGEAKFDLVLPSSSVLAEPPVAIVEPVAAKHGTRETAKAYLDFLYTPAAQELVAKHHYRPRDAAVAAKYANAFPPLTLFRVEDAFGSWREAQKAHFDDGGSFDRIYTP